MFRQPTSRYSSIWDLCCRVQENSFVALISALALSDEWIKLASDAGYYNCKWVFSGIFFTAHHICETELGAGIQTQMTCMSEPMVMKLAQNTYSKNTKSFDLVSLFLQLGLPNWSSPKLPHLNNLIILYICVLT